MTDRERELREEIGRLREVLTDACAFMLGHIQGSAQRDGIVAEAIALGAEIELSTLTKDTSNEG